MRGARVWLSSVVDATAAAIGFLTVLPVPEERATRGRANATAVFPWVGLVLGALALLVRAAPLDPIAAAALAVAALALATGGLHWDGWADVLDATGTPGLPRSRRIEILEDPRVGAHAALGVALLALVRVVALVRTPAWAVLMGAVFGRWVMVVTLRWAPTLRNDGAGARLAGSARPVVAALAPIALGAATAGWGGPGRQVVVAIAVGAIVAAVAAGFVVGRLGGMNGDGHGAVGLLAESAVWAAAIR